MLGDEQHTFVLAGLVSKTEAAYFVYNEVRDTKLQVLAGRVIWMASWTGSMEMSLSFQRN